MLFSDCDLRVKENRKEYLYLSRIYAYGELENMLGYDILMTNSIELYNDIYHWHNDGDKFMRNHKIEDTNGRIFDVVMYLWIHKQWRSWQGLVCLVNDADSINDAIKKYNEETDEL